MHRHSLHEVRAEAFNYVWDNAIPPALEVESGTEVVAAEPFLFRKIKSGVGFFALRGSGEVFKIAAKGGFGSELVGDVAVRLVAVADVEDAETGVEHGSVREALLIAQVG